MASRRQGTRSLIELRIAMYPIAPILRPVNAARCGTVDVPGQCLWASHRRFFWQAVLGLGAAACIIGQHVAMPPRQPCSAVVMPAQIQSWGG